MQRKTIIFDATEAVNRQRRGIGVQMRSWLESAPFAAYPDTRYILISHAAADQEPLRVHGSNVSTIVKEANDEAAFIDHSYSLKGDVIFFPLAAEKYVRSSSSKIVGVDYGMEDLYCRDYIAPQPVTESLGWHEYALRRYSGIVTVSKTSQTDLAWFFPEYKDKVHVIYPGSVSVETAGAQEMSAALRDTAYFLVIGYEHKKNIMRIVQAYDAFKQKTGSRTKLALAGNPGYGSEEIDAVIASSPSRSDIVKLGYVAAPLKQLLMQQCSALVALPIYEGFGISALEGMEAGKVVLVSDNGSLAEVVGQAGYVADPFSVATIAQQLAVIDQITDDPRKRFIPGRLAVFDQQLQAGKLLQYLNTITA